MGGTLQFQSRHFGNVAVATPAGRLDHSVAGEFEVSLLPLAKDPQNAALVIDFAGVDYISSVGLRVLMLAAKAARARKARIAAAGLQSIVAEIFAISRFDSVFEMFPSLPDALDALSPEARASYDASFARNG
jgi:anti-sigma B factor antagonist/stage II sporulation protein AA (anti-sigma F factor antagonist)